MSELVGILISGDLVLHLVDFDRPVWFRPSEPLGLRVIPDPAHFVADALAVFQVQAPKGCGAGCLLEQSSELVDASSGLCSHLESARTAAYDAVRPPVLFLQVGGADSILLDDLARLARPGRVEPLTPEAARFVQS